MSRPSARPSLPDARQQIEGLVLRLQYPVQRQRHIVMQLGDVWHYYGMVPQMAVPPPSTPGLPQDGRPIILLQGWLRVNGARQFSVPMRMWIVLSFPDDAPVIFVSEYQGAIIPRGHPVVRSDGLVDLTAVRPAIWRPGENSLRQLLYRLQMDFARQTPLVADPAWAKKKELGGELQGIMRKRMHADTDRARQTFMRLQQQLAVARQRNTELSKQVRDMSEAAGGGTGQVLYVVREHQATIEALAKEYGVDLESDEPDEDITCEQLLAISSGNPMRDLIDELEGEDGALSDTVEALSEALAKGSIDLPVFLKKTKETLEAQFLVRAKMNEVAAEMNAARNAEDAEASSSQAPMVHRASKQPDASRGKSTGRSSLLTTGMLRYRHINFAGGNGAGPGTPPSQSSSSVDPTTSHKTVS